MLPESAKKLREPIAALLLGAAALYLITVLAELLDDEGTFGERAFLLQDRFLNPAWVLVPVLAALLVTLGDDRTGRARVIVLGALAVLAAMALLGVISWLAGLGADTDFRFLGFGKITGSFLIIASLAVLAAGLWLVYSLFKSLPGRVRQQTPQQAWGGQPQQPWGGGQPQQQQWGGQPQQHWSGQPPAAPPAGAPAGWTAPGSAPPPQPPASQPPSAQSWGQQSPPHQQSWTPPGPEQAPGGPPAQPSGASAAPVAEGASGPPAGAGEDSTAVWTTPPAGESADPPPSEPPRREGEDDSRPGWWNPGS